MSHRLGLNIINLLKIMFNSWLINSPANWMQTGQRSRFDFLTALGLFIVYKGTATAWPSTTIAKNVARCYNNHIWIGMKLQFLAHVPSFFPQSVATSESVTSVIQQRRACATVTHRSDSACVLHLGNDPVRIILYLTEIQPDSDPIF